MNPNARTLILKAQDNLDLARRMIDDDNQHDIIGYNLAQSTEFFLKALMAMREIEFPDDKDSHDLDALMELLEEDNFAAISSHADVVELTPYNSTSAHIHPTERLNLREYLAHVEELKKLVGQQL